MRQRLVSLMPDPVLKLLGTVRRLVRPAGGDLERVRRNRLYRQLGRPAEVAQGPFAGLRIERWFLGRWLKQLLGTHEREVWPAIEDLCALRPSVMVNIGAANGYYAVGIARRLPDARIVAFEADPGLRRILRRTARANNVADRVEIRGWCDPHKLHIALESSGVRALVSDCEGGEDILLDPHLVPQLKETAILVELHEHLAPGVQQRLWTRFEETHRIRRFVIGQRSQTDLPPGCPLTGDDALFAMDEHRQVDEAEIWWMVPLIGKTPSEHPQPGPDEG